MTKLVLALALLVAMVSAGHASKEQTHRWKSTTVVVETDLFGVVEVKGTANVEGDVETVTVAFKGASISIPAKWIKTLPAMRLSTIEVRTAQSPMMPGPWLYVVFRVGSSKDTVHLTIKKDKLDSAMITVHDGKGNQKNEVRKAP